LLVKLCSSGAVIGSPAQVGDCWKVDAKNIVCLAWKRLSPCTRFLIIVMIGLTRLPLPLWYGVRHVLA